jgi:hypothetical protein
LHNDKLYETKEIFSPEVLLIMITTLFVYSLSLTAILFE